MSDEICYADAVELAARIRAGELSPVEVVRAHLERIEAVNPALNAIVTLAGSAMERARQAEAALARGECWGPLHGVPFTVKDCLDTAGLRTTRGSLLFSGHVPAADATAVARLKAAGGILLGKTNTPEFTLWWETNNRVFGRTENPWKPGRTAGGSSGGEAAALAAGLSPLGLGSDLGGSIRQPAHYCGVVGLKATHGRIPLTGHWPEALLRFNHVGPMARSVRDIALALSLLAGYDPRDHYALPVPVPAVDDLLAPLPALRVGWFAAGPFDPVEDAVRATVAAAAAALADLGCRVEEISLAAWEQWPAQRLSAALYLPEARRWLEPFTAGREEELAPSMQRRLAQPVPSLREYIEALAGCEALRADVARLFGKYDLLLCPAGTMTAPVHEARTQKVGGRTVEARHQLAATVSFSLTGSPAISVPFGLSPEGLPVGVQLAARHFDEPTLLRAAAKLEELRRPRRLRPPVPAP